MKDNRRPGCPASARLFVLVTAMALPLLADATSATTWQLAAGPTMEEGGVLEIAARRRDWELAAGYITRQTVRVDYTTPTCPYLGAPAAACTSSLAQVEENVSPFAYLSLQRRFQFRDGARLRPQAGLGLVAQSDTNEYVSTTVNFSLSLGLALSAGATLEWRHFSNLDIEGPNLGQDALLLRWQFR